MRGTGQLLTEIIGKWGQLVTPRAGPHDSCTVWDFHILKLCLIIGSFFSMTINSCWRYYRNLGMNNKYTIQYNEGHQCLSGDLYTNWVTGLFRARMNALHSFTATLSVSFPLLFLRAYRTWRRQQDLQELEHRNILFHPEAFQGTNWLMKIGKSSDNSKNRPNSAQLSKCQSINVAAV